MYFKMQHCSDSHRLVHRGIYNHVSNMNSKLYKHPDVLSVKLICADSVDLEVFEGGGGFRGETNCIFGWNSGGFNMAIYGTCV